MDRICHCIVVTTINMNKMKKKLIDVFEFYINFIEFLFVLWKFSG